MLIQLVYIVLGFIFLAAGSVLGYFTRQSIARKQKGSIEAKLQKRITQVRQETEEMLSQAKQQATKIVAQNQAEVDERRREILKTEKLLFKREHALDQKISDFESKEKDFETRVKKLKEIKEKLDQTYDDARKDLERISGLSEKDAKEEILKTAEKDFEKDLLGRIQKLKHEGEERYGQLAKEMIVLAMQRYAQSQAQEITTTTLSIPSEEVKGRIIGKEGRNIRTLEKLTGVEIIVDETPETVVISGFNPLRRHIAKVSLERLIKDGRIQPARIEEVVQKVEEEVVSQIKELGEKTVYDVGIVDFPPKLTQLIGRLYFRTSYGQNVLLHSVEVAFLASTLAEELGADVRVARKAGLLHDIGKAVDHQIQGSHVDIGIKILEKFAVEKEVIRAMKAHHEEYEAESLEAVIVKVADQISGARVGARKDTVENYLNRLKELEDLALSFPGIATAYAIQAGREIRVFVKPEEIGDLEAYKLAKDIAAKIQEELNYPGEIKINVIRETRVTEYAR
jgi:ribonuclease Y